MTAEAQDQKAEDGGATRAPRRERDAAAEGAEARGRAPFPARSPEGAASTWHDLPTRTADLVRRQLARGGRSAREDGGRDLRNLFQSGRLLMLVLLVSAAMGVAAWAFLKALELVTGAREAHGALFALLPAVSVATAWLYRNRGLQSRRGNNLVIDSALAPRLIHARMAVLTFCCSVATHLSGGSAGREGAAVQIGGTIASNVSNLAHLDDHDHHDLMLAGISSAFGAVFGTPLAGAFFGMEMCYVGRLDYSAALYCLAASFTGNAVCRALGIAHEAEAITAVPAISVGSVAFALAAAVAFGITARLFAAAIRAVKGFYATRFKNYLVAALAGSLVVLAAYALLGAWRYAGLSTWMVGAGFRGETGPADPLLKLALTALTLGAGFQGGEVTPLFGIGASLGGWLGQLAGVNVSWAAALGMIGVFGAALNVPLTTVMMGLDLFGGEAAPYFVLVAFVAYLVAGHSGVYPAQRIVEPKRRSLAGDVGETVADALKARKAR